MNQNNISLEKVVKGLECCLSASLGETTCSTCTYRYDENGVETGDCEINLLKDAITLLKAQEPVSVQKKQMEMVGLQTWGWVCGNCGQTVLFSAKFCPWCGREVKW